MQTSIHPELSGLPIVKEANAILRSCVHCGFCTAVCPTSQLLGDELDGPRGRIYLVKILKGRSAFRPELRKWVKTNSDNRYLPHGAVL